MRVMSAHGCISCSVCHGGCPICHPLEHQHNFTATPYQSLEPSWVKDIHELTVAVRELTKAMAAFWPQPQPRTETNGTAATRTPLESQPLNGDA